MKTTNTTTVVPEKMEGLYHISQEMMIVSLLPGLTNLILDTENEELHRGILTLRLSLLLQDTDRTYNDRNMSLLTIIYLTASYAHLEEIEIKAYEKLKWIKNDMSFIDCSRYPHDEVVLKTFVEGFILPFIHIMGISLEAEFAKLDALADELDQ